MTDLNRIQALARADALAWRTTGPRVVMDGVAYRLKLYGWIREATGAYVVVSEETSRFGSLLDAKLAEQMQ